MGYRKKRIIKDDRIIQRIDVSPGQYIELSVSKKRKKGFLTDLFS